MNKEKKSYLYFKIMYLIICIGGLIIVFGNIFNSYMIHGYINQDHKPYLAVLGFLAAIGGMILFQLNEITYKLEVKKENGNNKT